MDCKYKYKDNWYSEEEVLNLLRKENISFTTLYNNLIKELETSETGRKVFEQVKRDYKYKKNKFTPNNFDDIILEPYDINLSDNKFDTHGYFIINNDEYQLKYVETSAGWDIIPFKNNIQISEEEYFNRYITEFSTRYDEKYTLEEQQEEAIVTLLGLMAADKLDAKKDATLISKLKELWKQISDFVKQLLLQDGIKIDELPITTTLNDLAEIMAYGNNKIILPGYKIEYSTPLGNKYDTSEEVNNEIRGLADTDVEVDLSDVKLEYNAEPTYKVYDLYNNLKGSFFTDEEAKSYLKDFLQYNGRISRIVNPNTISEFVNTNKEYEQSKEIIEQWKKENNIKYDPEEVYSRGQGFYSSIGAYSNLELDLLLKNLIQHIQDNKKAGGEFTISAFTKPIDKRLKHIEGTGDRVRFVIYPKSEHIKWAAPTDVYSGSVWDAHEKVSKDKKSELLGVSFTKAPALRNINEVSPNLADIIDNLSHAHNELGIELTTNNFRIEYDDNINYSTKKLIDSVNKILDDKYGKLEKPEIKEINKIVIYKIYKTNQQFNTLQDAENAIKEIQKTAGNFIKVSNNDIVEINISGKQPTQTRENTKHIGEIAREIHFDVEKYRVGYHPKLGYGILNDRTNSFVGEERFETKKEADEFLKNNYKKEYTSQALINTKIAALKEVARRYPRSLITSKVVPINPNMVDNSEIQYSKKQGYNPKTITDEYGNTWNEIKLTEKNKEKIFLNKSESKVNNSDKYFKDVIQPLIKTLSKKFPNTKVTIISENELPEKLKGKNINSYYKNNQVFIVKEKVTPEITIEEFLHPFVNVLKESNEELYKSLLKEAKQLFPELRADIKDSYKEVYNNKDDINKEFLTQVLSKKVSQKQLTLFEQFKNWLKELLFGKTDNINLEDLDIDMKLGDVISMLSDNYIFNINDYSNEEFYSQSNDTTNNFSFIESLGKQSGIIDDSFKKTEWSNEVNNLITQQYEFINPSFEQKRSCEKLMSFSNDLAGTTEKNYILKNNTSLDRASTILKQDERFKFNNDEFNEEKYENNRIWGNQIDDILRAVVLYRFNNDNGKIINEINLQREKRNEESLLSEEIVNKLIYEFNQFLKQNENKIALPQIFLYNENKKIGGTADLILVDKFGNCEIIDLKSSVNPTNFNGRYFENYIKTGENGNEYINRYDKAFNNEKASKKERHEAQLSLYAGCLEARAIPLNESKPLQILPIHILNNEDNYVNKINVEKIFSIQLNKEYLNKTNIDSEHNLRIQNNYETDFEYNVNTVILSIKNEIALLKHIKIENTEYSIKELEKMLKILENQNFINSNKLAIYIVELHKTFISGDINFQTKLNYLISDINNKKITDHNLIIEKLLNYKKKVNHFRPLINDLIKFYNEVNENNLNNNDPDSIFSKLIQINTVINQIDEKYEKIIIPFLAENFYQFTDTIPNKNIEQRLNRIQERIDEIKSEYNSKLKESNGQITKDIKKLKERFEKLEDELKIKKRILLTTKEDIINQLKSGSNQDISMLERKFLSPQDSSNVFISGAAQIIDNNNNDLRQKLIEIQEKFLPSYREYAKTKEGLRNNPKEFNEGLFETITVGYFDVITKEFIERQELALVQEKDITKFNKEKQLFLESIKNITDKQEYFKKLNDWYLENTEAIQSKDTIIEGIVIKKGYLSIINSKLQDVNNRLITQKQFDTWYQNTFIIDKNNKITDIKISTKEGKELRQPSSKYTNQKWLDLQKGDISKLNYYNTLVSLLIESKNKYPLNISHEEKFILPQIDKKSYELLKENGIKEFGKDNLKRLFNERESDKKLNYGESTESSIKVIPIMFNDKIDLEKVSVDLAQSILLYSKEANYYESKVKLEPLMTALMLNLSKNTPKKIDSKGRLILKDFAKELNLPGLDKYINSSSNNIEALFKYYIDNMIYGISREKAVYNTPLGEVDMHSLVDTISAIMSHTSMGLPFGLFSNLSNYLQGTVQNSIEAHSEQFFEKSDLAWANKEYLSYSNDFVKNIVDEIPETFIGQLIEIIDPFIGEFKDQFGRKISKSKFRILINSSPFMFFQNIGEHNIQLTTMLALLKSTKLKDEQGKETNLYDIYKNSWNPETKKIEIKSNILSQLGSTTSNGLLSNAFKNKLNYILQSTHGNYAKQTAPEIKKDWFGRVFIFMRNFMATSIAKRWRGEVKNYSIMDMTEGYNRTFWRLMIEEFKEMKKVGFGFHTSKNGIFNSILKTDTSKLTPLELANLRRNAMDMAWVFATGLLSALLLGLYKAAGDDDEKSRIAMYLAPVMRLNSELSAFGQIGNPNKGFGFMPDIGDIKRGLMTPTVMYSYITKTFNFVEQIPKDITNLIFEGDIQRYEDNSGYYDKGTSKLLADLLKLFGATPGKLDAKEAIKSLYLQQNR